MRLFRVRFGSVDESSAWVFLLAEGGAQALDHALVWGRQEFGLTREVTEVQRLALPQPTLDLLAPAAWETIFRL